MKRGDIILIATRGDYGKPRPAVIVQADALDDTDSVLVSPMTSVPLDAPIYRVAVAPDDQNGLRTSSQIMVEKTLPVRRSKCGAPIGRLTDDQLAQLDGKLTLVIGLSGGG